MRNVRKTYTLWHLPETPGRQAITITNTVFRKKRADWVEAVFIDGNLLLHVDNCTDIYDSATNERKVEFLTTNSDLKLFKALENGAQASEAQELNEDVKIEVTSHCHFHSGREVWHLQVAIEIEDEGAGKFKDVSFTEANLNSSTPMFANDEGECIFPEGYRKRERDLNCARRSEAKRGQERSPEGRQCACESGCSIYGDPYVYDFYTPTPNETESTSGSTISRSCTKESGCFKLEKRKKLKKDPRKRVLFSFGDLFGVKLNVDRCEFTKEISILMHNPHTIPECMISSFPGKYDGIDDMQLSDAEADMQYSNVQLIAKCVCDGPTAQSRQLLQVPSQQHARTWYSPLPSGYDLGIYAKLRSGKFMRLKRDGSVNECAEKNNIDVNEVVELVDYGAAQVTTKCHYMRDKGKTKPYFNVCVRRSELIRTPYEPLFNTVKRVKFRKLSKYLKPGEQQELMANATSFEEYRSLLLAMDQGIAVGGYCPLGQNVIQGSVHHSDDHIYYMPALLADKDTSSVINCTLAPSMDDQALDDQSD